MISAITSLIIWIGVALLVLIWLPLLAIVRLLDPDPAHYNTGKLFRKLGMAISRINPNWNITISGRTDIDDRQPYVVVCNHLSQADIPLISNLPWEMKWVAKKPLFEIPVVGWMMRLAGDISVDRRSKDRGTKTIERGQDYLDLNCSVMFFPEGTRSRNGGLNRFSHGAFALAISKDIPILPLVIDGTQNTLPKNSWKFGQAKHIKLRVLEPIDTENIEPENISELSDKVRSRMAQQLSEWRAKPLKEVDNMIK